MTGMGYTRDEYLRRASVKREVLLREVRLDVELGLCEISEDLCAADAAVETCAQQEAPA